MVDGTVVMATVPVQVNPGDEDASPGMRSTEFRNELVAVDVNTGKEAWRTGMAAGRAVHLVPTADDSVVAFQSANLNGAKAVWRNGVFVMFKMIHRDENKGEVESVAFALPT